MEIAGIRYDVEGLANGIGQTPVRAPVIWLAAHEEQVAQPVLIDFNQQPPWVELARLAEQYPRVAQVIQLLYVNRTRLSLRLISVMVTGHEWTLLMERNCEGDYQAFERIMSIFDGLKPSERNLIKTA